MEIKIERDAFTQALGRVLGAVGAKNTIPILNSVLLQTNGPSQIILTGTDLELGIQTACEAEVLGEGIIAVPARKTYDIVRELPGGQIEIIVTKNNAVNIKARKSFFKIMGSEAVDFPKFPDPTGKELIRLDQSTLKQCLELTAFAISHDEARYTLNGVLVRLADKKARFVATDGKRLAYAEKDLEIPEGTQLEVIIPNKTIFELEKNLSGDGEVTLISDTNQIVFKLNGTTIVSRLIEGRFPNYEQVIPKSEKTATQLNREEFLAAAKRASLLTSQENQSIKLDFIHGKVMISSRTPNLGEAKEEIDADVRGDELSIGFNPTYLIDVLKNLDVEQVSLSMTDADKPGLIKGEGGYLYVVMPMQIN